ncbi:MAG: hypothetical protein ILO68_00055, partial [Clostridia bacterium]|nr:hypothetical protein [Clostridia bacterium]
EEKTWAKEVAAEHALFDVQLEPDLEQADFSGLHVHDFQVDSMTGDCGQGLTVRLVCSCGETREYVRQCGHEWGGWTVALGATTEAEGRMERHCAGCGKTETRTLSRLTDADGDGYDDETGEFAGPVSLFFAEDSGSEPGGNVEDSSAWPTWAVVLVIVLSCLLAVGAVLVAIFLPRPKDGEKGKNGE